ncbi:MAG: ArsR/SmtB family transcription factor [Frankiaceae bacterium]
MTLRVVPKGGTELRAVANANRVRILALLAGQPMTVSELAKEMGLRRSTVSQHVRQLAAAGTLFLAGGEGSERRYRRLEPAPKWRIEDDRERLQALNALAFEIARRWSGTQGAGAEVTFDGEMWVEPRAWGRACEQMMAAVETLRAAVMPPHAAGSMHVSVTSLFFDLGEE